MTERDFDLEYVRSELQRHVVDLRNYAAATRGYSASAWYARLAEAHERAAGVYAQALADLAGAP